MPRIQETKDRYFITLPKTLVQQKGWKKGDQLFFVFNERGNLELTDQMRK